MKIQKYNQANMSFAQQSFQGLHVIDTKVQGLLLENLNPQQLNTLSTFVKEQESNSVHILLGAKNKNTLQASLLCNYRLKDFKTEYKQLPIFESKFHFIKRVIKIANGYKQQIKNLEINKLKWSYSILPEWKNKIYK